MKRIRRKCFLYPRQRTFEAVASVCTALFLCLSLAAQREGPMKLPSPPPSAAAKPESAPVARPSESSGISTALPDIPVDQIIQKFAERELEFKRERDNFTYEQTFIVQTIDLDGQVDGEYRESDDIVFTPEGKRYEKVTDAPQSTLTKISVMQEDLDDLKNFYPFVLTTLDLPVYDVKYVGQEKLDEVDSYVFDVAPKIMEKKKRYFQGRVWVDQKDLEIVKTYGKAVPDVRKKNGDEFLYPHFETFRENIEGNFWFPTYTRSDEVLHFSSGDLRVRTIARFRNYKRFNVTIKIGTPTEAKPQKP